jgi:hypothetical protein
MPNRLGIYDPEFYANEALILLYKSLGMGNAVYRGFDKSPQQKGSNINIRRPGTFQATNMPAGAADQDVNTENISIRLSNWQGVQFSVRDDELTFTGDQLIQEHIQPAAFAVADAIDLSLTNLYAEIPQVVDNTGAFAVADIANLRRTMFDNAVPTVGDRFLMVNGAVEANMISNPSFFEADKSADGGSTQITGRLGRKFGYDIFANQNVRTHTQGAITASTPRLQTAVTGGNGVDQKSTITLFDGTMTGTLRRGDIIAFAGVAQRYAVTADATAAGNAITVTVTPNIRQNIAANTAVTFTQSARSENLAFHRNAFALAMAPLSDMGNGLGARIAYASDPVTGLALRSTVWYEAGVALVKVRLDALWGVDVLDPRLAVRYRTAV